MERSEKYIVYLILGDDEAVLYVGITKRKHERLTREHFTPSGHVDPTCYREAKLILYTECVSQEDAAARERYLIKTRNPRFNEKHNKPGIFSFSMSFDWQYLPVDKSRLDAPPSRRRRRPGKMAKLEIPSFDVAKQSLGVQLSFDCSPARIEGPAVDLTWLDGEKLDKIVEEAWAECGSPGPFYGAQGAILACKLLSAQDWVGHTEYAAGLDDAEWGERVPYASIWGTLGSRLPWLTARGDAAVRDELTGFVLPWHVKTGLRSLVGTLATNLSVSARLYDWRDDYLLALVYLREVLQAGARVEDRYLLLTQDLQGWLLHDWFVDQSTAVGYKIWVSGVVVQPDQAVPSTICQSNGKRDELESRWHREVFPVGRSAARRLNRAVWVYSLPEIRELQIALEVELKRLLEGATEVCYHGEPFAFRNYYKTSPLAGLDAPRLLVLN